MTETEQSATLSLRAYAKHRGVSLPAVQKALRTGRITALPDGKIDSIQADGEWAKNTTPRPQRSDRRAQAGRASTRSSVRSDHAQSEPLLGNLTSFATARSVREQYLA